MRYLYDHGLPFNKKLAQNLDDVYERVHSDKKASLIIVDGIVGEGKTTLGVHCADYLNKKHGLVEIQLDKKDHPQIAMGGKEFIKNLRVCFKKDLIVILYDEAGDFNRRGSLTQFNAMLNRTFETFRAFKIIVIMCLPNFSVLDNQLLDNGIPRFLLHCFDRNNNYGNFALYSLGDMFYIKKNMMKETIKMNAYKKTYPRCYGQYLDLDPKRSKKLDALSTASKLDIGKISEIKMDGLVSFEDLSKKTLRSIIWVKKAISKIGIKHNRVIDKKKYFNNNTIDQLLDYIDKRGEK